MNGTNALKNFTFAPFVLHLNFLERAILPEYKGSMLRGAFGATFKNIVCALRDRDCAKCILKNKCVYSYIFETPIDSPSEITKKYQYAPHPFVLNPGLDGQREFKPGERLAFGLRLIGRSIDYLPYFIYTFDQLGNLGLGKARTKFSLEKVTALTADDREKEIYSGANKTITSSVEIRTAREFLSMQRNLDCVKIKFLSPARMVFNGKLSEKPEFHIIFRNLLRRISTLSYYHCGEKLDLDFKGLIKKAEGISTISSDLKWRDWERFSNRQKTTMMLGGVLGEIVFQGELREFIPFLALGEWINVGKGSSFGLGQYSMLI